MTNSAGYRPAYLVADINSNTDTYIFKAAVYNTLSSQPFTITFASLSSGNTASLTILTYNYGPYTVGEPVGAEVLNTAVSTVTVTSSSMMKGVEAPAKQYKYSTLCGYWAVVMLFSTFCTHAKIRTSTVVAECHQIFHGRVVLRAKSCLET